MAYVKKAVAQQVPLASDSQFWVMWRPRLTYGQMRDIARAGQKTVEGQTTVDNMTATDALILAHIESWNLTGEDEQPLPLTPEGLGLLDEDDAAQLGKLATQTHETQESERKN